MAPEEGEDLAGLAGTGHVGTARSEPGRGVRGGTAGLDHRTAAAVARARPDVALAPVSVEARTKGRAADSVDSEQELASKVAALVHASTAGGTVGTAGTGGEGGGGAAGALGVSGAGSHPAPLGDGSGDWFDTSSSDPRIVAYFRGFHAKVDPLWADAFPRSAMLELKQGTVILEVTIAADGKARVSWPPARPSGVDEFDRNCADAVRKASPFDPIPPSSGSRRCTSAPPSWRPTPSSTDLTASPHRGSAVPGCGRSSAPRVPASRFTRTAPLLILRRPSRPK